MTSHHETGIWHITNCPLFKAMTLEQRNEVKAASVLLDLPRNTIVPPPPAGEPHVFIVVSGRLQLSCTDARGNEAVVLLLKPCDLFGCLSDRSPNLGEHCRAVAESRLARIRRSRFEEFLRRFPDLAFEVSKACLDRAVELQMRLAEIMMRPADERLAITLLRLGETSRRQGADRGGKIDFPLTHADLGKLIGTSREMVTILLGRFRQAGLVATQKGWLHILDPQGLERIAAPDTTGPG